MKLFFILLLVIYLLPCSAMGQETKERGQQIGTPEAQNKPITIRNKTPISSKKESEQKEPVCKVEAQEEGAFYKKWIPKWVPFVHQKKKKRNPKRVSLRWTYRRLGNGYERVPGIRFSFRKDIVSNLRSTIRGTYDKARMESPDSSLKIDHYSFQVDNRYYFSNWVYAGTNLGAHHYVANPAFKTLYAKSGMKIDEGVKPFVEFSIGMRPSWKLPLIKRRPVLQISYTIAEDFELPSATPLSPAESTARRIRFKFGFSF